MSSIAYSLQPRFFVSYSRKQKYIAEELQKFLKQQSMTVWFDQDAITIGDNWMEEIRKGIHQSDELVLIVSPDSLKSEIVSQEITIAETCGKIIRPFVLETCTAEIPAFIQKYHYEILATDGSNHVLFETLFETQAGFDLHNIKLQATRGIFPPFSFSETSQPSQNYRDALAALNAECATRISSSTLVLNTGLANCMLGHWEKGLELLREYASAANHTAGWYFLALHLPQRSPLSRVAPSVSNEITTAIGKAYALGASPLIEVLALLTKTGLQNHGLPTIEKSLNNLSKMVDTNQDPGIEFQRLFWAVGSSFPSVGAYEAPLKKWVQQMANT